MRANPLWGGSGWPRSEGAMIMGWTEIAKESRSSLCRCWFGFGWEIRFDDRNHQDFRDDASVA
jgi:hypothetical protein